LAMMIKVAIVFVYIWFWQELYDFI
jgi:hypothetical protein